MFEIAHYQDSKRNGDLIRYNAQGIVLVQYQYKAGQYHGRQQTYHLPSKDGEEAVLSREAVYNEGRIESEKVYNSQGKLIKES
jgi:antitoxin component YwqK of YwqJK toxin-antitoxin module